VSFDEIVGQGGAKRSLIAALEAGRVPGGYLFLGPRGVGKFLTALALARALLCETAGAETP
jgi:DNA polymerase-3 subunit delta'